MDMSDIAILTRLRKATDAEMVIHAGGKNERAMAALVERGLAQRAECHSNCFEITQAGRDALAAI